VVHYGHYSCGFPCLQPLSQTATDCDSF
jgi:hypothetical protein